MVGKYVRRFLYVSFTLCHYMNDEFPIGKIAKVRPSPRPARLRDLAGFPP